MSDEVFAAHGWIDSHCHLQDLDAPDEAVERAIDAQVAGIVCVGTDLATSARAVEIAAAPRSRNAPTIWASVGVHPHEALHGFDGLEDQIVASRVPRGASGSIVAVGECGLDYHYDHSPRADQRASFVAQIALAKTHDLALVIHTRQAWDDTFEILSGEGVPERTIVHCFTGGPDEARRCLELGTYLSFSGIVTFKNASDVREALMVCPLDRLLIETDAPYLAPVPHRGSSNEPGYVSIVGETVAKLRGVDEMSLRVATSRNCERAFALQW